jgi:TolB-like protein/Flp pilus assembly protein TadD
MGLFVELKRRKVVSTTAAYLVAAFAAAQVTQLLADALDLPSWILRTVVIVAIVAIPFVVAVAWVLDVSREGVHVTDSETPDVASVPWRRLAIPVAASVALLFPGAWFIVQGITPPETIRTLAVLPFENTGGAADDDYFSDGMRDELAGALARIPGLRVAGRTSSYMYKGRAVAAEDIGRTLGVHALIAGTVRRAGDRLRVTAQLVGTADGKVMWDSVFESRSNDVFGVQDQFTRAIVAALMPALSAQSRRAPVIATLRGTSDLEAYELYLKGRSLWLDRGYDNVLASIPYFRQAIARDQQFARAYAGMSLAYGTLPSYAPAPSEWSVAQEAAARRAVALDPKLPDARLALGLVLGERYLDFVGEEAEYRAALALEPGEASVLHVLGLMLASHGRTDEGLEHLLRATRIDPLAKSAGSGYAAALTFARRFPDAMAEARRVLASDSTFVLGLLSLGFAQAFGGMPDSAIATLERSEALYPEGRIQRPTLVYAYAAAGRRADAERLRAELHMRTNPVDSADAAFADLVLGDPEPLLQMLERREGRRLWLRANLGFGCNPMLDPLRDEPRYQAAVREMGTQPCTLPQAWTLGIKRPVDEWREPAS